MWPSPILYTDWKDWARVAKQEYDRQQVLFLQALTKIAELEKRIAALEP